MVARMVDEVDDYLVAIFESTLHKKRLQSLGDAVVGTMRAAQLAVSAIGKGLAAVKDLDSKHAIKQVDRLFSNVGFDPWLLAEQWVPYIVGDTAEIFVNVDWTDFDGDGQATLMAAMQTGHGRAIPLLWKTVQKSQLKNRRNDFEDHLLIRLHEVLPATVRATIIADRGFADQKLFTFLGELGVDFIIRLRGNITVERADGESRPAKQWTGQAGRLTMLKGARVTADRCPVPMVVCVRDKAMKDDWCLVSSRSDMTGSAVKQRYGKRFTIEETFRDFKDLRHGMGMAWTHVRDPLRRDRMIFVALLAHTLLTLLGAAGEAAGLDRLQKPNTSKRRVYSLFNQGATWFGRIPTLRPERLLLLFQHFNDLLNKDPALLTILQTAEK